MRAMTAGVRAPVAVASLDAVLAVATTYPVFPCGLNKQPHTAHGFKDASQDEGQITAWWRTRPDALVGVPTGIHTRIVVIDYDPDKADAGTRDWVEKWSSLLSSTFSTETPRGGRHWYFQSDESYASGANVWLAGKQRRGLDIRADGGYVIYWPVHGLPSIDESLADIPPGFLDDRKRVIPANRTAPKRPQELLVRARQWAHERDRVIKALAYIKPDDRDVWLRIGLALHLASSGDDDAFAVWHAWSAGGMTGDVPAGYCSETDCRYHWQSFNLDLGQKTSRVTLGTLFALAQAGGYESKPLPALPEDLEPWLPVEWYTEDDLPARREPNYEPEREKPPTGALNTEFARPDLFRTLADIVAEKRESEWLPGLHKILEAGVMAVLAGKRGTFKSFISLHWSLLAATQGASVAMLSGEGAGLGRRVEAWRQANAPGLDVSALKFVAIEQPVNLNSVEMLQFVSDELVKLDGVDLIVIDTFSKFVGGLDENSNADVAGFLSNISALMRDKLGATVLIVAHAGHSDASRPRGASALMANPDADFDADRPVETGMSVSVTRERYKDSASLAPLAYEAKEIDLNRMDRYGESVSSLVMADSEVVPISTGKRGGVNQKKAVSALVEWARVNPDNEVITGDDLRDLLKGQGLNKYRIRDMITWLIEMKIIANSAFGYTLERSLL